MRVQNCLRWQCRGITKIACRLIRCCEWWFGQNWQPPWIVSPLVISKQFLSIVIIFCNPQKHIFRDKFCVSAIIWSWDMENPNFGFLAFYSWRPFRKCLGRVSGSQTPPYAALTMASPLTKKKTKSNRGSSSLEPIEGAFELTHGSACIIGW